MQCIECNTNTQSEGKATKRSAGATVAACESNMGAARVALNGSFACSAWYSHSKRFDLSGGAQSNRRRRPLLQSELRSSLFAMQVCVQTLQRRHRREQVNVVVH